MTKPEILQIGPYPEWDQVPLEESFVVHKYYEAPDKAALLAEVGPNVRGIATRGELGADAELLAAALSTRVEHRVEIHQPQRGERKNLVDYARRNAKEALGRRLADTASQGKLLLKTA